MTELPSAQQPTQPQPQVVQPQPVNETWVIDPLTNGGVMIQIFSVNGTHVSFFDADIAVQVGEKMQRAGRQAKSGLIVPTLDVGALRHPPNGSG